MRRLSHSPVAHTHAFVQHMSMRLFLLSLGGFAESTCQDLAGLMRKDPIRVNMLVEEC